MAEIPENVLEDIERLTQLADDAIDEAEAQAYREERDETLAEYGYTARVREDDTRDVLVCYPTEWIEDSLVQPDRIDDVDRGIERPLSGPDGDADWETVTAHNDAIVTAVAEQGGSPHAETARALADFASNHYSKPIEDLTRSELEEFRDDYFERNAWPSDDQRQRLEASVRLTFEKTEVPCPFDSDRSS